MDLAIPESRQSDVKSVVGLVPFQVEAMQAVNDVSALNQRHLRRRFEQAAASFDAADFVHRVTCDGLVSRLQPVVLDARTVLDLGSATAGASQTLRRRFRSAHIISLDISHNMLACGRRKRPWYLRACDRQGSAVQADATRLPIADGSIDIVFCNLLLPFIDRAEAVFTEVARILRKDGVFAFATLGPDSLLEIRRAWSTVDTNAHVNHFPDMHDVGDALVRSGLRDPVLDVDRLSVSYRDTGRLFSDLTSIGARNALQARNTALVGKHRFERMLAALGANDDDPGVVLDLELVYGHCWGAGAKKDPTSFSIDAAKIPRRHG